MNSSCFFSIFTDAISFQLCIFHFTQCLDLMSVNSRAGQAHICMDRPYIQKSGVSSTSIKKHEFNISVASICSCY